MSYKEYNLNWIPSPFDARDKTFRTMRALRGATPAENVSPYFNLAPLCSPVRDQGQTGECTGQSVAAGAAEFLSMKTNKGALTIHKSVKAAYYNGRRLDGTTGVDAGSYIRSVIKGGARWGFCETCFHPETSPFSKKPSVSAYADGSRFQLTEYANLGEADPLDTLANIRATIYHGLPVCFGFDVYSSFMSDFVAKTGKAPVPKAGETREGGHAVLAVGYDDVNQRLIVRNSWGAGWGRDGYFSLPYWFISSGHASDFWTITGQEEGNAKAGWFSGLGGYLFGHTERNAS